MENWGLEGVLVLFLLAINAIAVLCLKDRIFYKKYTFLSIVQCISSSVLLTFGLYAYDCASDIQVYFAYSFPQSCNGTSIEWSTQKSIIGYIKQRLGLDTEFESSSEFWAPLVIYVFVFMYSTITTIPSLKCVIRQIRVKLWIQGTL